jgi:hypothetical protein
VVYLRCEQREGVIDAGCVGWGLRVSAVLRHVGGREGKRQAGWSSVVIGVRQACVSLVVNSVDDRCSDCGSMRHSILSPWFEMAWEPQLVGSRLPTCILHTLHVCRHRKCVCLLLLSEAVAGSWQVWATACHSRSVRVRGYVCGWVWASQWVGYVCWPILSMLAQHAS